MGSFPQSPQSRGKRNSRGTSRGGATLPPFLKTTEPFIADGLTMIQLMRGLRGATTLPTLRGGGGQRIVRGKMTLMEIPQEGKKFFEKNLEDTIVARKRDARAMVKKQAEELLAKAGFAVQVVDKSKVERNGVSVSE